MDNLASDSRGRESVEYEILRRELALEMDAVHAQRKKGARNIPLSM